MFYQCRHSEEEIVECMQMLGDRTSLAAIHRIKGVKEETVCTWLERAASCVIRTIPEPMPERFATPAPRMRSHLPC